MNGKRKIWALMLAVVLCLNTAAAFASPSKTVLDMVTIGDYTTSTNAVPAGFVIYQTEATTPWMQDLETIGGLANPNKAPINFFEAVKDDAAKLLPENTDLQKLQMNEFIPISALNYEVAFGDITAGFVFPTFYPAGQPLVAMAAVYTLVNSVTNEWSAEWFACPAEAKMGKVYITFPADYVAKLEGGWGSLAILN